MTEASYEKMLENVYKSLPKKSLSQTRFKMPQVESFVQGNKTVIKNFSKIMKSIHRDEKHALKFITKESGTASLIDKETLVLNGKFWPEEVQKTIEAYIEKYVLCNECKRPDTKITEQQGVKLLKCEACGAMSPIRE